MAREETLRLCIRGVPAGIRRMYYDFYRIVQSGEIAWHPNEIAHNRGMGLRLLIIDDHPIFVDGLKSRLKKSARNLVLQHASNLAEALALLSRGPMPDLILLDIGLPGRSGLEGLPDLRQAAPSSPVVFLSAADDPARVRQALRSGGQGFLSKSMPSRDLMAALRRILKGETVVATPPSGQKTPALAPRQRQVLSLLAEGLPNKVIAERLGMAPNTVRTHLMAIFRALGATTRTQAVILAQRLGLISSAHDA